MTYEQLSTFLERYNIETKRDEKHVLLSNDDGFPVTISETVMYSMNTNSTNFNNFNAYLRKKVFKTCVKYASTPLNER